MLKQMGVCLPGCQRGAMRTERASDPEDDKATFVIG